ncbi:MAG: aromatic ring-hydroxylating dioxygenase subunit alpha [Pyrinomonadaceae bacterium]|jgi:choline monooxygenase|nr:aromatic ring-hydroxylating dioxygenase subunit alpha [Pyrinomonadaceae bacterium]
MFNIESDITIAETLSSKFYTDESFFYEANEKIFARTWHYVGVVEEIDNLKPFNILDTPLVLTKNGEKFNCISNVCTHRGAILVENDCQANGIRCRYHGKRFSLDGKFLSMPEFENAKNFPSKKDDLPKANLDFWDKFIFASLSKEFSLDLFLAEMKSRVQIPDNLILTANKDYHINAHWALYCENYLEGFHVPFVHPALNNEIDFGTYTTELFRYSNLQTAYNDNGELAALHFFIFPNMMFNFYPWGLSLNIVRPINLTKTTVSYYTFVSDESKIGKGAGGNLELVEAEDQAIVLSVQKGIRSSLYDRGRYSPTREQGTHHFHQLIAEFFNA